MRTWEPMATYPFRLTGKSMWSPVHAEGYSSSLCIHYISGSSPLSAVCLVAKPILLLFLFTPSSTIAFFSLALPFPLIHDSHKDKARALYLWIESKMQCMRKHGCKKTSIKEPLSLNSKSIHYMMSILSLISSFSFNPHFLLASLHACCIIRMLLWCTRML